eukprot:6087839-Ditylum_brightwellii.AAC.1
MGQVASKVASGGTSPVWHMSQMKVTVVPSCARGWAGWRGSFVRSQRTINRGAASSAQMKKAEQSLADQSNAAPNTAMAALSSGQFAGLKAPTMPSRKGVVGWP